LTTTGQQRNQRNEGIGSQARAACLLAWAAGLALCHGTASAGRPFSTEDAGVIAKGACEVEAFGEWLRPSGGPNERGLSAQLGCGIIGATQLAFALSSAKAAGEKSRAILLSGKSQLVDGGDNGPSFALAYFTGRDRAPNESWRSGATGAVAVVTAPLAGWLVHANLAVTAERQPSRNVAGWAMALERPAVVKGWTPVSKSSATTAATTGRRGPHAGMSSPRPCCSMPRWAGRPPAAAPTASPSA
jgi:hypothetical protein